MLWAGIVDNQLIGPVMVPACVKLNSAAYCELLSEDFFLGMKTSLCHFGKRSCPCKIMRLRIQLKQLSNTWPRWDLKTTI